MATNGGATSAAKAHDAIEHAADEARAADNPNGLKTGSMVTTGDASVVADTSAAKAHADTDPSTEEARAADNPPAADDGPPTALLDHLGPDELGSVFKELDLKARCTAMQVCTTFRAAASARADAWRECDFGSGPRA